MARRAPSNAEQPKTGALTLGLFLGLLVLNAVLVSPYLGWYDSGEMVGATAALGISHPSGQVLFHLLGKIFLLLPWGTPAYQVGLMSAACSALASVLFFHLSLQLAGPRPKPRLTFWILLLTLAWSFSLPWWRYSLTPLVYALHLLLGMLLLWVLSLKKPSRWLLAFLILGAATVFRPTQFFALPFVGLAFLWDWRRHQGGGFKTLVLNLTAFILGRSTALYLPLRSALDPSIAYGKLTDAPHFLRHLFALKFSHYVGHVTGSTIRSVLQQMFFHLWNDLSVLGLVLLAGGLFFAVRENKKIPVFLWVGLGWGALEACFVFTIPFPTFESHQVLLGWVFSGLLGSLVLAALDRWSDKDRGRFLSVGLLLILWVLVQSFSFGHFWERKKERGAQDYARNLLDLMEPGSFYVPAEENEYFPVVGYQESFDYKKSVEVLEPGADPAMVAPKIKECLERGKNLYVSRKWPLPPGWSFRAVGPLLKVGRNFPDEAPRKISSKLKPLAHWGKMGLESVVLSPAVVPAGGKVEITYRWTRLGPSPSDETDSVVALFADANGNYWMKNGVFWLHDIHEGPLGGLFRMKPGYLYEEKRILFIPSDYPPGRYRLAVGLQRSVSAKETGKGVFGREFYERGGAQNLEKFMGRGEDGAVVQFSAGASDSLKMGLWPLVSAAGKPADSPFAPTGELEITPPDNK